MQRLLTAGQHLALMLLVIVTPTTFRDVLWSYPLPADLIFVEFRGVLFFPPMDSALILLLLCSLFRAIVDVPWRSHVLTIAIVIFSRFGGVAWLLFLLWMVAGLAWARLPVIGVYQILHLSAALLVAWIVAAFVAQNQHKLCVVAFLAGASVQAVIAMLQWSLGTSLDLDVLGELALNIERGWGLTVNPNNLAGYLLLALFLTLYAVIRWKLSVIGQVLIGAAGVCIVGGLLAATSLTALMALVVTAGGVLIYVAVKRLTTWQQRGLALLAVALVGAAVIASALSLRDDRVDTLRQRLTYGYPDTLALLHESPLLGAGTGNGMVEIGWDYAYVTFQWDFQVRLPAHNAFLMEAANTGLIGMVLYLLAWGWVLWRSLRLTHPGGRVLAVAFLCVTLVSLFDYYFRGDMRSQMLLFVLIGALWGEMQRETAQSPQPESDSGGYSSAK